MEGFGLRHDARLTGSLVLIRPHNALIVDHISLEIARAATVPQTRSEFRPLPTLPVENSVETFPSQRGRDAKVAPD